MTTTIRTYDFDTINDRRSLNSIKWSKVEEGVLPMWVADMDYQVAPEITEALQERVAFGDFGYTKASPVLTEIVIERMARLYNWNIQPEWIVYNPGMVLTLGYISQAIGRVGDGVLLDSPVYHRFYDSVEFGGKFSQAVDLTYVEDDANTFHYEMDFDAFEAAITRRTSLYFMCDPHNPTGKIYSRAEQERLAEICLKHGITIAADHIHADLLMGDSDFQPLATLSPEVAQKSITMFAPTKTFNIPGLACSIAIIPDKTIREKMGHISHMNSAHVSVLSDAAALAAYQYGEAWLQEALAYMTDNRDLLVDFIRTELPMLKTTVPDATYLAWLDCRALDVGEQTVKEFFLKESKVAFSDGEGFGKAGAGFIRFNFATTRHLLLDGLQRMKTAIDML